MKFIGRDINFAVAVESTRGTAETTASRTVRKVECNLIPKAERVIDDSTFGRLEDAERVRTVRKWNEGDVSGIVHADVLGYFLLNLYGDVISSADADGFEHVFSLEQSLAHPTLTMFVKDGEVRQQKIAGGVISSLEISATTDNYVRYNASFIGKSGVDDTSELPALATEYDFIGRDIEVKIASTEAGLVGATALKLKGLKVTWNSNAEADYVFGSLSPDEIDNRTFSIEGEFERNFVDETFKDLYEGDGFVYMQIKVEGEELEYLTTKPAIVVLLNKVQVTDWSRTSGGNDLVTETVSFKAFLNADDEQQSEVTLTNFTETYAIGS